MKKIVLAVMLSMSLYGQDVCDVVATTAEKLMEYRQEGKVSYRELYKRIEATKSGDPINNKAMKDTLHLLDLAFDKPRFATKKHQERAVRDFSDYVYRSCKGK